MFFVRTFILIPLSWFYRFVVFVRLKLYKWGILRTHNLPVKVISVGNLTTGGTGKTPACIMLIRKFQLQGLKVAYLSRGYMRKTTGFVNVAPNSLAEEVGDEALLVKNRFPEIPVAVCEDRYQGGLRLVAENKLDAIILDDAFQHVQLHRDLDFLVVDATTPPWKDKLLPIGRLREPYRNYKRSDLMFVTKINPDTERQFRTRIAIPKVYLKTKVTKLQHCFIPTKQMDNFATERISCIVFSGLGNNQAFHNYLNSLNINVLKFYPFPDHHIFSAKQLKAIKEKFTRFSKQTFFKVPPILITTEKDYFRIKEKNYFCEIFSDQPIYYLKIETEIESGEDYLNTELSKLFNLAPSLDTVSLSV